MGAGYKNYSAPTCCIYKIYYYIFDIHVIGKIIIIYGGNKYDE